MITLRQFSWLFLLSISLWSCVSKTEFDKIEEENEALETELTKTKEELAEVNANYQALLAEKMQAEIERNRTPYITEIQALQFIDDNYSFYETGSQYRNVKLRRVSNNVFEVSLEECNWKSTGSDPCERGSDYYWTPRVRTLTVHGNGKYDF